MSDPKIPWQRMWREAYCEHCEDIGGYEPCTSPPSQLPPCEKCHRNTMMWQAIVIPEGTIFAWEERDEL